jgi:hypothetical protein
MAAKGRASGPTAVPLDRGRQAAQQVDAERRQRTGRQRSAYGATAQPDARWKLHHPWARLVHRDHVDNRTERTTALDADLILDMSRISMRL